MIRTKWHTSSQNIFNRKKVLLLALERVEKKVIDVELKTGDAKYNGYWLESGIPFNHGISLINHDKEITLRLFSYLTKDNKKYRYKKGEKLRDLEILMANLIVISKFWIFQDKPYRDIDHPVRISLNPNNYTKNRYTVASKFIIELIHMLENANLLKLSKGYNYPGGKSRRTRIWPTAELLKMYHPFDQAKNLNIEYVELVILRDKNGKEIDYIDNTETNRIRKILNNANAVNRKSVIQIKRTRDRFQRVNTDLHAVFHNSSFTQGGRLYTGFNGYQSLAKDERTEIQINGESTVELDFSGLHPRLLYALEGIQYPNESDPYAVVSNDANIRPLLKRLLFMLFYSENEIKAVAAGNYEFFFKNYKKYHEYLEKVGIKELIQKIKNAHRPIAKYLSAQACFKLMNIDSKIALDVIEHFTSRQIAILAIHDSFIVSMRYENELREVMKKAYQKNTRGFDCPINRK